MTPDDILRPFNYTKKDFRKLGLFDKAIDVIVLQLEKALEGIDPYSREGQIVGLSLIAAATSTGPTGPNVKPPRSLA